MPLLDTRQLSARFGELVRTALSVDIAVAWITSCDELDKLCDEARRKPVRVIVGLAGNATHPVALKSLRNVAPVRVGYGQPRTFHPKFYLFRSEGVTTVWIGSPNLTTGGFSLNRELVHEFSDDGESQQWFEAIWEERRGDNDAILDDYCDNWAPPEPPELPAEAEDAPEAEVDDPEDLLAQGPQSWAAYVTALRACDAHWQARGSHAVLREQRSYVETISTGRELTRRQSWADLDKDECQILMGNSDRTGVWGLLGSMKMAQKAVSRFQREARVRETIRRALVPPIEADGQEQFIARAIEYLETVRGLNGFSSGVATRLLTLARPDRAISVNNGSAAGIQRVVDDARDLSVPRHYEWLLRWLYQRPWYDTPEPTDATRMLWHMRAALVDAFVYKAPQRG